MARTTLNIDDQALAEALEVADGRTKTAVINEALREFARRRRLRKLLKLRGKVGWEGDLDQLRERRPQGAMRVLVDTSVWADFFNGFSSSESDALALLLDAGDEVCTCGLVVAEVFQGLRRQRASVEALFRDLTFLGEGNMDLYLRAADLFRSLRKKGVTVRSTVDCILVAIAESHGCVVLARDRDIAHLLASDEVTASAFLRA